jgi:hypothetical protein
MVEYKFQITLIDLSQLRVEARFFPADVKVSQEGEPEWFIGPHGFSIPIDEKTGKPITMDEMNIVISKSCPRLQIEQEIAKRTYKLTQKEIQHYREHVGTVHKVTDPIDVTPLTPDPFKSLLKK